MLLTPGLFASVLSTKCQLNTFQLLFISNQNQINDANHEKTQNQWKHTIGHEKTKEYAQ
jgi:hypothetical protein